MRKWLGISCLTIALGSVGGYFYFEQVTAVPIRVPEKGVIVEIPKDPRDDAEPSEDVEPIHVSVRTPNVRPLEPTKDDGPLPRVVLEPGVEQPPRPDEESGRVLRMPYADE